MSRKDKARRSTDPAGLSACAAGRRGHAQGFRRGLRDRAAPPRAGPAHLRHRRHDARLDRGRHVGGAAAARAVDAGRRRARHRHAERRHHAHALSARRCSGRHAGGLPRAADVAAAARADRARDRAAAAVRRERPGGPCRGPDPVRAAWPAVLPLQLPMPRDARLAALCQALLDDARRPAHARRLGAARSTPAPAPWPAASRARPASASAPGASRRACSRRWAGWAAARR